MNFWWENEKKTIGEGDLGWIFKRIKKFGGEVERGHQEWDVGRLWEDIQKVFFGMEQSRDKIDIIGEASKGRCREEDTSGGPLFFLEEEK